MSKKALCIKILTIEDREGYLYRLVTSIAKQCKEFNLFDDIQLLISKDKRGEHSIGYKRNICTQHSNASHEMFVDDDDMLENGSLFHIVTKIKTENPDCIRLDGTITTDGQNPKKFIHSIEYRDYFEKDGIYYRPPNHLNPIRSSIAKQFKFPEINFGEDTDWAMQIARSGLIKTESNIGFTYYIYDYKTNK